MAKGLVWWVFPERNENKIREREICLECGGIWGDGSPQSVTMSKDS